MFIGHLPAGYLVSRALAKAVNIQRGSVLYRRLMATGLIASVAPDLDLFYFYLVDNRQTLHHHYFTHMPYFWLCFFMVSMLVSAITRSRAMYLGSALVFASTMLHMVLDTIVGRIRWGFPFSFGDVVLVDVPAVHDWWVLNFILHWTFLIEVAVVLLAAIIFYRHRSGSPGDCNDAPEA